MMSYQKLAKIDDLLCYYIYSFFFANAGYGYFLSRAASHQVELVGEKVTVLCMALPQLPRRPAHCDWNSLQDSS